MRTTYAVSPPIENKESGKLDNEASTDVVLDIKTRSPEGSKRIPEGIQA
ncbi:MAG TPA: hypothetical protein VNN20_08735 [Thermodesulfobacteriota bacterium]|nr:hypothetical protein [Thermodesulfobacteriota bacterium]